jgi:adenylate cyclase
MPKERNGDSVRDLMRFDFHLQTRSLDRRTGLWEFALRPDPRRYTRVEMDDGTVAWYDRFDDVYVAERALADFAAQMAGFPIGFQPQEAGELEAYLRDRRPEVASGLRGDPSPQEFADASEEWLRSRAGDELGFVVMSVDLVGSTPLAQALPTSTYAKIQTTVQSELAELVALFRGHVLKYTGDGVLAYFPEPSFGVKNDLAVECALYMRALVRRVLNPELETLGLRPVDLRVGIDGGEAAVAVLGSARTKRHADLIGEVVSLACKIEAQAPTGSIALGAVVERNLHTSWREYCRALPTADGWKYEDVDGEPYKLFVVEANAARLETGGATRKAPPPPPRRRRRRSSAKRKRR